MARIVFIGGCERSGTTLLQKMLLAHPEIAGGPEFLYSRQIAGLYAAMSAPLPSAHAQRRAAYPQGKALEQRFRTFYESFFTHWSDQPEVRWVVEKTPSNIFAARELLNLFDDAVFVSILRDARDVALSWREVMQRARAQGREEEVLPGNLRQLCGRWNRAAETHLQMAGNDRFVAVQFEDLVARPAETLAPICTAMGVEETSDMLDPRNQTEAFRDREDDLWWTGEINEQPLDPSRAGRWRQDLGLFTRLQVQAACGQMLAAADYPVGTASVVTSRCLRRLFRKPGFFKN